MHIVQSACLLLVSMCTWVVWGRRGRYMERDPVRGKDSFAAFEEMLLLAKQRKVRGGGGGGEGGGVVARITGPAGQV